MDMDILPSSSTYIIGELSRALQIANLHMPPLRRCCWAVLLVAWPSLPWCLHAPLDSTRRRLLASFLGLSTPVSVAANARPDATDWAGAFAAKNAANAADGCIRSIAKKYVDA